jgi:hypothetical protein
MNILWLEKSELKPLQDISIPIQEFGDMRLAIPEYY